MSLRILRILLYIQLLLGLIRYTGIVSLNRVWDVHQGLGVVIFFLAIWALRPLPAVPNTGIRIAARFFAILPLALGIGFQTGAVPTGAFVILHMLLGIATIALVEMASGQVRRSERRRTNRSLG